MPKEISVQDLLSKLSANSFLVDTTTQRFQVTPGIFLGMHGKFFKYSDVVDTALKIMNVNQEGKTVVDLEQFVQQLAPKALDLNEYFKDLEKTIKNPKIFDIELQPQQTKEPETSQTDQTQQTEVKQTPQEPKKTETEQSSTKTYSKKYSVNGKTYGNGKYYSGTKTYSKKTTTYTKKSYKQYNKKSGSK